MDHRPRVSEADLAYTRHQTLYQETDDINMIPEDDMKDVNTYTEQTISLPEDVNPIEAETAQQETMQDLRPASIAAETAQDTPRDFPDTSLKRTAEPDLAAVPDADEIAKDSPVDPAAPDPDAMHGTDLINGYKSSSTHKP